MRNLVLILNAIVLSFYAQAYEGIISSSGSCGATDADCHYDLYEDGHLEITGTGSMNNYGLFKDENHLGPAGNGDITAPWGYDYTSISIKGVKNIGTYAFVYSSVQSVDIEDGVESIDKSAFNSCYNLQNVNIGDSVTSIGEKAFAWSPYYGNIMSNLIIPNKVTSIGKWAFRDSSVASLVIDGSPDIDEEAFFNIGVESGINNKVSIFCRSDIDCTNKGQNKDFVTVILYTKNPDTGFYQTEDGKLFASLDLMAHGAACTDTKNCQEILNSNGKPFKVGSKIYNSIEDFANGNYVKHRIYTINEANRVAGEKNRVSITYR